MPNLRALLPAFVIVSSCHAVAQEPAKPQAPRPYHWKTDGGLRQKEAEAKCREEQPTCKRTFATWEAPPNPCANKGARCLELPKGEGSWTCACDECLTKKDCKRTEHCGTNSSPCDERRSPLRCLAGPAPKPVPCPPPPRDPPSLPQ